MRYKVGWSMRGRIIVDATDEEDATEKALTLAADDWGKFSYDCDGIEIDFAEEDNTPGSG